MINRGIVISLIYFKPYILQGCKLFRYISTVLISFHYIAVARNFSDGLKRF